MEELINLINLTPHEITIFLDDRIVKIPPSGKLARLKTVQEPLGTIRTVSVTDGEVEEVEIPVVATVIKRVDLPPRGKDTYYIVSSLLGQMVAAYYPDRYDILSPDTGPSSAITDQKGRIIGVRRLQRWVKR